MKTEKLIERIRKTNKEVLCELIENIFPLIEQLEETEDEKEKKEIKYIVLNALAIVKWNIKTM